MKTEPPIGIGCRITEDKLVIPDPGFEGSFMEDQGFRGEANFSVLAARGTEPAYVICNALVPAAAPVAVDLWPVINWCVCDYSWWDFDPDTVTWGWTTEERVVIFGGNGPEEQVAAGPGVGFHIGDSGDEIRTETGLSVIRTLAYTYFDYTTLNAWKMTRMRFYRWQGEAQNPNYHPYGRNNRKVGGVATVEIDIWKRTFADAAAPAAELSDVFSETKSFEIDASEGTTPDGVPSGTSWPSFTNGQIDTFASISFLHAYPQTKYASNRLKEHFYPKTMRFTVVPP